MTHEGVMKMREEDEERVRKLENQKKKEAQTDRRGTTGTNKA